MFQSYNAFTQKYYKLVMWIIYPVLAIFGCVLVQNGFFGILDPKGYHFMIAANILCNGIIFVEIMGDYWLFSGIQSKNANHLDLLKSSRKGRKFYKDALISDVIRRGLTILLCFMINVVIGVNIFHFSLGGTEGVLLITSYVLLCYMTSTLGVLFSRYGEIWYVNFGVGYGADVVSTIMILLISKLGLPIWIWIAILLAADIIVTICIVKIATKKVEESYYDQRS